MLAWQERFPEESRKMLGELALSRLGDPEKDIGRVAVFLASDDANHVTGHTLVADGGRIML